MGFLFPIFGTELFSVAATNIKAVQDIGAQKHS
jgi:hypothetical protein